jgi:hypothetical protein
MRRVNKSQVSKVEAGREGIQPERLHRPLQIHHRNRSTRICASARAKSSNFFYTTARE